MLCVVAAREEPCSDPIDPTPELFSTDRAEVRSGAVVQHHTAALLASGSAIVYNGINIKERDSPENIEPHRKLQWNHETTHGAYSGGRNFGELKEFIKKK